MEFCFCFDPISRPKNALQRTALNEACGRRHLGIVKDLLEKGANLKTTDHDGESPLHVAVIKQRSSVVEVLLQHRAEANMACKDESYPLHVAAQQGSIEILKCLLRAGAALKPCTQPPSPPHLAVSHKQTEVLRLLLYHGAVATEADENMDTALTLLLGPDTLQP